MKGRDYIVTYISALVIGILLLIFHEKEALYNTVVLVIGALIALPSLILLILELTRKKRTTDKAGYVETLKWSSLVASIAGLAIGIWMLVDPAFFVKAIIYTLGAILILAGLIQIIAIYLASRPIRPILGWFIVPVLTIIAGCVIVFLGADKVASFAGLVTGIMLVVYAANGLTSAGREAKVAADVKKLEENAAEESAAK
ncbi:MAG: DUF308 domain-containing protein [Muribaculaceae bacterium]|nr:DUF308 domain-containing protein [Muribaculaceae bacterium]